MYQHNYMQKKRSAGNMDSPSLLEVVKASFGRASVPLKTVSAPAPLALWLLWMSRFTIRLVKQFLLCLFQMMFWEIKELIEAMFLVLWLPHKNGSSFEKPFFWPFGRASR